MLDRRPGPHARRVGTRRQAARLEFPGRRPRRARRRPHRARDRQGGARGAGAAETVCSPRSSSPRGRPELSEQLLARIETARGPRPRVKAVCGTRSGPEEVGGPRRAVAALPRPRPRPGRQWCVPMGPAARRIVEEHGLDAATIRGDRPRTAGSRRRMRSPPPRGGGRGCRWRTGGRYGRRRRHGEGRAARRRPAGRPGVRTSDVRRRGSPAQAEGRPGAGRARGAARTDVPPSAAASRSGFSRRSAMPRSSPPSTRWTCSRSMDLRRRYRDENSNAATGCVSGSCRSS